MKPKFSNAKSPAKAPAEAVLKDIRRQTRRHFSAEEKIRIVLDGLRGEDIIAELCRKDLALAASGCDSATVLHKPRLLSDNGPCYIAGDLAEYIEANKMRVEDQILEHGVVFCHVTVRFLWNRFGPEFAPEIIMRTARSRTSGANVLAVLLIVDPSSQELGSPAIPGRFDALADEVLQAEVPVGEPALDNSGTIHRSGISRP
jgi:hypothetical protein